MIELPAGSDRLVRAIVFEAPERLHELSAWTEHTPFAFWIIDAVRPRMLVELGVQSGVSYCAFCQAVQALALSTACYAVDTWAGDPHTNPSDLPDTGEVLGELRRYHDRRYGSFSTLVQSSFLEARAGFADGSVDLLHIDGYHLYEAVRDDFESWLPKLSDRAVVLFHDINERHGDFGAWRFWEEIRTRYPSFHFLHAHGLGVLAVGREQSDAVRWLTSLAEVDAGAVRSFFAARGREVQDRVDRHRAERRLQETEAQAADLVKTVEAERQLRLEALRNLDGVNTEIAYRQGVIDEARRQIAEQKAKVEAVTAEIAAVQANEAELEDQLTDQGRRHEKLLAQTRLLEHRVAAYESSTSWRLTAPLRVAGRVVLRLRRILRFANHRFELSPAIPLEHPEASKEPAAWYRATSSRDRLPDRWVSLTYSGSAGPIFLMLFVDQGDGKWVPIALPSFKGHLKGHIFRLPNSVVGLRLKVQGSEEALSAPPVMSIREVGEAELLALVGWRQRHRIRPALRYLLRNGVRATVARMGEVYACQEGENYQRWVEIYDTLSTADRTAIAAHIATFLRQPMISVVVPVYNTPEAYLRAMLESVLTQLYPNWELCIADDASTHPHVRPVLEEYARRDPRVKVVYRTENGHISAASNSALELASGSYVALLDHDDLLSEHALYLVAVAITDHPDADVFYSDEDKIDEDGVRSAPYFKPDWGHELLLGQNYVSHLGVYRREAIQAVGGFRLGFEGSQDYDLLLRVVAVTKGPIVHLPWILYHWRLFPGAGTFSSTQLDTASAAARRAIGEHLAGRGVEAKVETTPTSYHRAVRSDLAAWPKVSAIVPTRDHVAMLRTCVEGLLQRTDYPDIELIIANNSSRKPETLAYFEEISADPRVRVLDCLGPFNYSAINNAAIRASTGEIVLLLNNDIEIIGAGWLKEMVKHAVRPEVGAVGAKLLYPDNTLQHGGVVLGLHGVAGHLHIGLPHDSPGYFGWLSLARNVSAVTAACLVLRRSVFEETGGLDEINLKVAFNDVDLCLKITELGYQILWTPEATLFHLESKSRGSDMSAEHFARFQREVAYMRARWGPRLDRDPFFNPNLSLTATTPIVGFPPRREKPWLNGTTIR